MRMYQDKSDDQLVALYVDGVNEAFDTLIERHKDRLYSYIFHSVKSDELADDIFNISPYLCTQKSKKQKRT